MVQEGYAQDGAYQPPQQYPADAYAPQYGAPQQPLQKGVVGQRAGGQEHEFIDPSGKYQLKYKGAFAAVEVAVRPNDGLKAEAGVMITLDHNVDITAQMEGSLGTALCLGCCSQESFFFSHFSLKPGLGDRGEVLLAPGAPGEIILLHLDGATPWAIQKGGFLACDQSVQIGVISQGIVKGCCSGLGFFIVQASGQGRLLLSSFGSIIRYDVAPGERRTIDNGFLVAWTSTMKYEVGKAASTYSASLFSGEGFVTHFTGPGTVFVQTRSIRGLANELRPYLPSQGGGGSS
jgi:uncharacterized protein (TIGR00266 family)